MDLFKGAAQRILATERALVPSAVKRFVRERSPLDYFMDEPIGQIFLADEDFDTFLCVNDFFSVLNPDVPAPVDLEVALYDGRGRRVVHRSVPLPPNGNVALSARELLAGAGADAPIGLATCDLRPRDPAPEAVELYKRMGRIASHFFTYFLNTRSEAMGIIHPQSSIHQSRTGEGAWRSGQSIVTAGLEGISLLQANHGRHAATVQYELCDATTDRPLATTSVHVPPTSAAIARFDTATMTGLAPVVFVRAARLPTPNGKPLLMRRYGGGRFSMNHA